MILTNEEIMDINQNAEFDSAIGYARKIESAVLEKLKAQEHVGETVPSIVWEGLVSIAWEADKQPPPGTKLYTNPLPPDDVVRDAERYRWLREKAAPQWRNGPGLYWYLPRFMDGTPQEKLDASIDAAMKEMK